MFLCVMKKVKNVSVCDGEGANVYVCDGEGCECFCV